MERSRNPGILIYIDGGCRGNPGPGAWAAVLIGSGQRREIHGVEPRTTNNRMELTAAIEALRSTSAGGRIQVVTDSQYLKQGITEWLPNWVARRWKTSARKPVKNRDLWEALHALTRQRDVDWRWVRGHSGDRENERCDELVNRAMDRYLLDREG